MEELIREGYLKRGLSIDSIIREELLRGGQVTRDITIISYCNNSFTLMGIFSGLGETIVSQCQTIIYALKCYL